LSTIHACFNPGQPVPEETITQMLAASEYWQPDATSNAASRQQHCQIAKASLFNTARSKQDHLYHDQHSGCIISANARLDNRSDVGRQLGLSSDVLSQLSDSQLILNTYQRWGEVCPKHLLGDFVFIIWDESKQRLFCARDHFGVKVLFYCRNHQGVMLSNEHNAFFTSNWQPKAIREQWLVQQLWGQGPYSFQSPFQGIELLPPAHSMIIDHQGTTLNRYWTLEDKNDWQGMDDEALIEELKNRFRHAVKVRLDSAYPLATELSEGLDSNGIAGFAARMLDQQPLHTFSYGCQKLTDENKSVWEKTYQDIYDMLDMHDNLQPVWTTDNLNDGLEHQADCHRYTGGLFGLMGGRPDYCKMANARGVRVLLSGWGGDHCASGYGDFFEDELFRQRKWSEVTRLFQQKAARGRSGKPFRAWMNLLLKHAAPPLFRWKIRNRGGLEQALWQRAGQNPLRPEYIKRYQLKESLRQFTDNYRCKSVKAYHRRELFEIGVENRLVGSELVARNFRVEYRFPMLDVPLVELAYNIPSHLKIRDGVERYMFRRVLEGITTERIQWRVKADVNHPNIDRESLVNARSRELLEQLQQSKLVVRYCDPAKLARLDADAMDNPMMLGSIGVLLELEQQLDNGDITIATAE